MDLRSFPFQASLVVPGTVVWEFHDDLEAYAGPQVLQWMEDARKRYQAKFHRKGNQAPPPDFDDPCPDSSVLGGTASGEEDSAEAELPLDPFDLPDTVSDEIASVIPSSRISKELEINCETEPTSSNDARSERRRRREKQLMIESSSSLLSSLKQSTRAVSSLFDTLLQYCP